MTVPLLCGVSLLDYAAAAAGTYNGRPPTWTSAKGDVHSYLSQIGPFLCIAQEGTQSTLEWFDDFDALPVPLRGVPNAGPVHQGIRDTALEVFPQIVGYLTKLGWPKFVLTGHSKGGGEVCLMAPLFKALGHPPEAVCAFEPPLVGTKMLADYLSDIPIIGTQTWNADGTDIVTRVGEIFADAEPVVPWLHLQVPDTLDIADKHRMPAVIAALSKLGE